jgi:hypothetical protein
MDFIKVLIGYSYPEIIMGDDYLFSHIDMKVCHEGEQGTNIALFEGFIFYLKNIS